MTAVYIVGALLLADLLYVEARGMWELLRHPGYWPGRWEK